MGKVSQETLDEIRSIRKLQAARRRSPSVAPKSAPILTEAKPPEWWQSNIEDRFFPWAEETLSPVMGAIAPYIAEGWKKAEAVAPHIGPAGIPIEYGPEILRGVALADKLLGLGIGAVGGAVQWAPWQPDRDPDIGPRPFDPPRVEKYPGAAKAFWRGLTEEGDLETRLIRASEAAQDELDAGWGYWGGSEVVGAALAPLGFAKAGSALKNVSAPLASTLTRPVAKVAPSAAPSIERGIAGTLRGTGSVFQAPLMAEEAVAGAIAAPFKRAAGRLRRPGEEAATAARVAPDVPVTTTAAKQVAPTASYEDALATYEQSNLANNIEALGKSSQEGVGALDPEDVFRNSAAKLIRDIDASDTITVWHGTNITNARQILKSGQIIGDQYSYGPGVTISPETARKFSGGIRGAREGFKADRAPVVLQFEINAKQFLEDFVPDIHEGATAFTTSKVDSILDIDPSKVKLLYDTPATSPKAPIRRLITDLSDEELERANALAREYEQSNQQMLQEAQLRRDPAVAATGTRAVREVAEEAGGVPGGPIGRGAAEAKGMPSGFNYVAPLRELSQVIDEVVTSENPLTRKATRLIAPSVGKSRDVEKAVTAYSRQNIAIDELSKTAVTAALDTHATKWIGRIRHILPIDRNGYFGQTGKLWNDVFSNPSNPAYKLTTEQRAYIDDYIKVLDEIETMRVDAGLEPLARTKKEDWFYIPRQVEGIREVDLIRPTNAKHMRFYEEATEGAAKGVRYLSDPRETLLMHVRSAYKEVLQKQLDDVLEPLSINAAAFDAMIPKPFVTRWQKAHDKYEAAREAVKEKLFSEAGNARIVKLNAAYQNALRKRKALRFEPAKDPTGVRDVTDELIPGTGVTSETILPYLSKPLKEYSIAQLERMRWTAAAKGRVKGVSPGVDFYEAELVRRGISLEQSQMFAQARRRTAGARLVREQSRMQLDRQVNKAKDTLDSAVNAEKEKLYRKRQQAQDARDARRKEYNEQRDAARRMQVVPGKLFGPNQPNDISVFQWRRGAHRFFPEEDYKALVDGIGEARLISDAPNWGWHGFQVLGNTIRFLASVGDFAMPLIHGLPLLARDPAGWGRMALRHHQAFFDPTVQARLIKDNLAEYQWLSRNGVPIGDPEFFAALAPGQGIPIGKITGILGKKYGDSARNLLRLGGKQSFGRFQAAYNVGLGYSRVKLLKGLRSTWKGTDAELAQYIRNMTGGLDSRALGVGPTQRSIEGMFLAFSPRLLRSTVALVADAISVLIAKATGKATTAQGRESLRTLAQLAGGVTSIYTLSGLALGKSWEEIGEGLNPLSGRRFLSHNINGDWIGVGGQIRSLTQFMASMYSTLAPEEFPGGEAPLSGMLSASQYENPFIRFYMSRGAPGISMLAGTIEAFTPIDALPFDEVDGKIDLVKHLGTSALPFATQLHLEGGEFWRRPSPIFALEMFGGRGGVDLRDRKSQEIFGEEYRHVEPFMQRMIREIVPEDVSKFDRIEQERRQKLLELLEDVRSGRMKESFAIWQEVQKINYVSKGARGEAGRDIDFEPADVDAEDPGIRALNQQNALFDDPEVMSEAGRLKYIAVKGEMVSVLSVKIKMLEMGWTEEQKDFVVRNTNTRPIPIELIASLPEPFKNSIARSQGAREKHLRDQGKYDLARLSRRLFSLKPVGE